MASPTPHSSLFPFTKVKTTLPMSAHRCRRRAVLCRRIAPFIRTSGRLPLPFLSAARGGKMAVQISKKRKVRSWGPVAGNCGVSRVRSFSACYCATFSPSLKPGQPLDCVAFPWAADGGGLSAGPWLPRAV